MARGRHARVAARTRTGALPEGGVGANRALSDVASGATPQRASKQATDRPSGPSAWKCAAHAGAVVKARSIGIDPFALEREVRLWGGVLQSHRHRNRE